MDLPAELRGMGLPVANEENKKLEAEVRAIVCTAIAIAWLLFLASHFSQPFSMIHFMYKNARYQYVGPVVSDRLTGRKPR